jgi:hypothetical protein
VILKLTWLRLRSGFKLKPSTAKKDRVPERDE